LRIPSRGRPLGSDDWISDASVHGIVGNMKLPADDGTIPADDIWQFSVHSVSQSTFIRLILYM